PGTGHRQRAIAARRAVVGDVGAGVARRHDHQAAVRERDVDGVLHEGLAGHAAAQAHVDDVGRGRVVRDARDVAARGPDDGVAQVGPRATHVAEHAHVLDLGAVGHAGHAEVVVGDRGHGAGHVRAVPAAVVLVVPVALVVRV